MDRGCDKHCHGGTGGVDIWESDLQSELQDSQGYTE